MIYIVILAYILVMSIRYDRDSQCINENGKKWHQIILYLSLSLIAGFSFRLGIDCVRYEMRFDTIEPINHFSTLQLLLRSYDLDPLWTLLMSVVKFFSEEFYFLHLVVALFVNGVIFWFVNKHTKFFFITILLYFLLQYWNYNFEILRETISVSFFLLALDGIIDGNNKILRYYLLAMPAIFFHTFGFVVLLFPIFKILNVQKHLTTAVIVTVILTPVIFFLMNRLIDSGLLVEDASIKMQDRYLGRSSSFNIFGIILSVVTLVAPSLYMIYKTKGDVDDDLRTYAFLYPLVIVSTFGYYMMYRIENYMFVPFVICVGQYVHNAFRKKDAMALLVFVIFFGSIIKQYFDETVYRRYIPYSSVFNTKIDPRREQLYLELLNGR